MSSSLQNCASFVRSLSQSLQELEQACELLQLSPLQGREWYDLLQQKLLPQLQEDSHLIVAVVGGTNIGKSVIFNHLARSKASASSPLASGTKHPVCLVPEQFHNLDQLKSYFEGFELYEWKQSEAALEDAEEHRLFWRNSSEVPGNLIILDTPDIDSDAPVNWHRADYIRRSADVLIAVLTQQKYNDAVVKQFFRKAAAEEKTAIVVFNQCMLPDDDAYWPIWLETFTSETNITPESVYLAPNDRLAAEENTLSFYPRPWPADSSLDVPLDEGRELTEDLSKLRFDEIKLQSLKGSLKQVLDQETGAAKYLREVQHQSREFHLAAERLSSQGVIKCQNWPSLPNRPMVDAIRRWWKQHQQGWVKKVNAFYDTLGQGVMWPFKYAKEMIQGEEIPPLEEYREKEWLAVLQVLEEVFDKLTFMSESGSHLLKPRFEQLLKGKSREELILLLKEKHDAIDPEDELRRIVKSEMDAFQTNKPEMYKFYKQINHLSAAIRPVTSVVLFSLGWGPAGDAVAPALADATAQTVVPIIADFAGGTTAALAGETTISSTASSSASYLHIKFQNLQSAFTTARVEWLANLLKDHLLGTLPEELQAAANVPESDSFREVKQHVRALKQSIREADAPSHSG